MRILFLTFVLFGTVFANSFITDMEYGKLLYKNPRGVGCDKCHGLKGEGSLIAKYGEYNQTSQIYDPHELKAPPINSISLQEFADGIVDSKGVMPSYFLTQDEIIVLYKYIKDINKKGSK